MPKITIKEVDLTSASNQPAVTDVAYVPGLSCLENATTDLTYCDSITNSDGTGFEDLFGTRPAIVGEPTGELVTNDSTIDKTIDVAVNKSLYEKYFPCSAVFVYDLDQKDWRVGKKQLSSISDGTKDGKLSLDKIGITLSNPSVVDSFSKGEKDNPNSYSISVKVEYDLSYVYAKELIKMGIPVVYQKIDSVDSLSNVFNSNDTEGLIDKGEYSIKYLTSGANPSFKYTYSNNKYDFAEAGAFVNEMLSVAQTRGDCVALIDAPRYMTQTTSTTTTVAYTDETDSVLTSGDGKDVYVETISETGIAGEDVGLPLIGEGSVWSAAQKFCDSAANLEYGAMFYPWAAYNTQAGYTYELDGEKLRITELSSVVMPASFGYLLSLGKSIKTNNNWLAVAGIARGQVPFISELKASKRLSNTIANEYQPRNGKTSINAITNIKPYGLTIWGNRTMKNNEDTANGGLDGLTATSFLNVRNMVSDVKKTVYNAAKNLMFEQNSDVLWINFLAQITPLLDRLMSGQGLSNYKIIKKATKAKAKLEATIKLYPIYAVEEFEVTIELSDEDVSVV